MPHSPTRPPPTCQPPKGRVWDAPSAAKETAVSGEEGVGADTSGLQAHLLPKGLCRQDCGLPTRPAFWPTVLLFVFTNSWLLVLPWTENPGLQLFIITKNYFWMQLWLLCFPWSFYDLKHRLCVLPGPHPCSSGCQDPTGCQALSPAPHPSSQRGRGAEAEAPAILGTKLHLRP